MPIRYITGLGGSAIAIPPYRYTQERELILEPNTRTLLVEATDKPINREIVLLCDRKIDVFWGDNSQLIETIYPHYPQVNHDGGMKLYGSSSALATVKIVIRSDQPIFSPQGRFVLARKFDWWGGGEAREAREAREDFY